MNKAEELKQISDNNLTSYNRVVNNLNDVAKRGEYFLEIKGGIPNKYIEKFKCDGFKLVFSHKNCTISWD